MLALGLVCACAGQQTGGVPTRKAEGQKAAPHASDLQRQPNNGVVDLDSQTVIAATILEMTGRNRSKAPVVWAKGGDFKAAYDGFSYDGFAVTGVDVFDQQQAADGKVTVQALVRLQHRSGAKAANALLAVYSDGKNGLPIIHKTLAGPIPSRDPALEVLVVPSAKVLAEPAFKEVSYPGWLKAARRLAAPVQDGSSASVHIFVFAKERVLAKPDLKVQAGDKISGQASCIDDNGFAACVVAGTMSGKTNKALFFLNSKMASSAAIE